MEMPCFTASYRRKTSALWQIWVGEIKAKGETSAYRNFYGAADQAALSHVRQVEGFVSA